MFFIGFSSCAGRGAQALTTPGGFPTEVEATGGRAGAGARLSSPLVHDERYKRLSAPCGLGEVPMALRGGPGPQSRGGSGWNGAAGPLTIGRSAEAQVVGSIDDRIAGWLGRKTDAGDLTNRGITWSVSELRHATRASKRARGAGLGPEDLDRIPDILRRPKKVSGTLRTARCSMSEMPSMLRVDLSSSSFARTTAPGSRSVVGGGKPLRPTRFAPSDIHAARYSPVPDDK